MVIYLSLLVALVGLVVYLIAGNVKVAELARLTFACGLLIFLLRVGEEAIKVLK